MDICRLTADVPHVRLLDAWESYRLNQLRNPPGFGAPNCSVDRAFRPPSCLRSARRDAGVANPPWRAAMAASVATRGCQLIALSDCRGHTLHNSGGTGKEIEFIESECLKRRSETLNSAPPAFLQQLRAACCRFQPDGASILGISAASHQARGLQSGNDFRHRWRLDLLDSCEFCQPHGTGEHENR